MLDDQLEKDLEAFIRVVRLIVERFFGRRTTRIDVVGSVSVTVEPL